MKKDPANEWLPSAGVLIMAVDPIISEAILSGVEIKRTVVLKGEKAVGIFGISREFLNACCDDIILKLHVLVYIIRDRNLVSLD